jgi:hypothetical protein
VLIIYTNANRWIEDTPLAPKSVGLLTDVLPEPFPGAVYYCPPWLDEKIVI